MSLAPHLRTMCRGQDGWHKVHGTGELPLETEGLLGPIRHVGGIEERGT